MTQPTIIEKRYVVPQGMLKAGGSARNSALMVDERRVYDILQNAICWLAENPIVPTLDQIQAIGDENDRGMVSMEAITPYVVGFQKIMFLAEVPDAVKNILDTLQVARHGVSLESAKIAILEAYRRGKESR